MAAPILGDLLYRAASLWTRLAGNTTTTRKFLSQTGTGAGSAVPSWDQVTDADLSTSNITTNNVSITKHGFTPILPNDATKYLDGTGAYTVPAGTGTGTVTTSGSPASGNLAKFSGATAITNGDLSGDATTSGTLAVTLANTAVTPASYTNTSLTVDSKGRITAASNGAGAGSSTLVYLSAGASGGHSPADGTTYLFGLQPGFNPSTTGTGFDIVMPSAGTVAKAHGIFIVAGTLGSNQAVTVRVRNVTAATTEDITTALTMDAINNAFSNNSMTLAFSADDRLQIQFVTPTWSPNPTAVVYNVTLVVSL